jgi:hypothetical protein
MSRAKRDDPVNVTSGSGGADQGLERRSSSLAVVVDETRVTALNSKQKASSLEVGH